MEIVVVDLVNVLFFCKCETGILEVVQSEHPLDTLTIPLRN